LVDRGDWVEFVLFGVLRRISYGGAETRRGVLRMRPWMLTGAVLFMGLLWMLLFVWYMDNDRRFRR
jgi:hypothetical protein